MFTKKGPGDLWNDNYDEVAESEFGECQECGEEISLSQVEKTKQHIEGSPSYQYEERHDRTNVVGGRQSWWVEVPYGICEDCLKEFEGEEG